MVKMAATTLALAMALFTVMAAQVEAVDITGFFNTTGCNGNILDSFPNQIDGACAPFALAKAGSVLFTGLNTCKESIVFNSDCANIVSRRSGPQSSVCIIGGGFTSAMWRTLVPCP